VNAVFTLFESAAMPGPARLAPDLPPVAGTAPSWAARARAARLWDAAGRAHVDWANACGAVLLGHADPDVEAAAAAPRADEAAHVAAQLASPLPGAVAARFTSDAAAALDAAIAIAVRATGRPEVVTLTAAHAPPALATRLAAGRTAAIVLGPDVLAPALAQALRAMTGAAGTLLVLDETATGLRRGVAGMQAQLRLRADLSAWGAGLANGRALGAVTGEAALLGHAPALPPGAPSALAAARATLAKAEREDVALNLAVRGAEIQAMLERLAREARLADVVRVEGDPTAVSLSFRGPRGPILRRRFVAQLAARGVHAPGALHVGHRHEDREIGALLDAAAAALQVLAGAGHEPRAAA
jgi:glutamate-1-semialdehyde 2,1-aminomutase